MTQNTQTNDFDTNRLATGAAGGALVLLGLSRRGVLGVGMAAAGAYLAYKAITGNNPVLEAAGITGGTVAAKPVFVEHSIVIDKPAQAVYDHWRRFENLPGVLSHLQSVTELDSRRSRWTAKTPIGTTVEWEGEIVNDKPGQRIGWHSLPGAAIDNAGSVQFESLEGGKTRVHLALSYRPPAGPLGAAVAKIFGDDPALQIKTDLEKFKSAFER